MQHPLPVSQVRLFSLLPPRAPPAREIQPPSWSPMVFIASGAAIIMGGFFIYFLCSFLSKRKRDAEHNENTDTNNNSRISQAINETLVQITIPDNVMENTAPPYTNTGAEQDASSSSHHSSSPDSGISENTSVKVVCKDVATSTDFLERISQTKVTTAPSRAEFEASPNNEDVLTAREAQETMALQKCSTNNNFRGTKSLLALIVQDDPENETADQQDNNDRINTDAESQLSENLSTTTSPENVKTMNVAQADADSKPIDMVVSENDIILNNIHLLLREARAIENEIIKFHVTTHSIREYLYETLLTYIYTLDRIEAGKDDVIRSQKRSAIKYIYDCITALEDKDNAA